MVKNSKSPELAEDRLLEKISIPADVITSCWLWTGSVDKNGYGTLRSRGKYTRPHRELYRLVKGEPGQLYVCHTCDNRLCANPQHLFLGSPKDNQKDMADKGRSCRGSRKFNAKLFEEAIPTIRKMLDAGRSQAFIAELFGVAQQTIHSVASGRTWRHIK